MAVGAIKISPVSVAGALTLGLVLISTLGTLAIVFWASTRELGGELFGGLRPSDWAAVRFTLWQSALSAAISIALAVPVARALARRQFWGRSALISLLGAPFILPVIVAVFGLLAIFGRSGIISETLRSLGLPPISIYGPHGVVFAHVFLNLPLAVRFVLQGWLSVPAERIRLAASLGFDRRAMARWIERPILRAVLPGAFLVIFLLCLTSFAVALALGGGPRATTIELAIYQAFNFEFDLAKAALLSCVQFTLCASAAILAAFIAAPANLSGGLDRKVERWDAKGAGLQDTAVIAMMVCFLVVPLGAILVGGVPRVFDLPTSVWVAAGVSLRIALTASALSLIMALSVALWVQGRWTSRVVTSMSALTLAASPLVMGTGIFIAMFAVTSPQDWAFVVTVVVNSLMVLPFALRLLVPAVQEVEADYGRLADHLGLVGWSRFRWLILPRLRRPLGFTGGLAAALSAGDLGVITLFADPTKETLPLAMFRLMGAYRMDDAAGAAAILFAMSLFLFWIFDRGGRVDARV